LPIVCGGNSKLFLSAKTEVELIVTTAPIEKYRLRNVKYLENGDRYTMMGSIKVESGTILWAIDWHYEL